MEDVADDDGTRASGRPSDDRIDERAVIIDVLVATIRDDRDNMLSNPDITKVSHNKSQQLIWKTSLILIKLMGNFGISINRNGFMLWYREHGTKKPEKK